MNTIDIICRASELLYEQPGCECGGPMHIVLDDGNVSDDNIMYCIESAFTYENYKDNKLVKKLCSIIGGYLLGLPEVYRYGVVEIAWKCANPSM